MSLTGHHHLYLLLVRSRLESGLPVLLFRPPRAFLSPFDAVNSFKQWPTPIAARRLIYNDYALHSDAVDWSLACLYMCHFL